MNTVNSNVVIYIQGFHKGDWSCQDNHLKKEIQC